MYAGTFSLPADIYRAELCDLRNATNALGAWCIATGSFEPITSCYKAAARRALRRGLDALEAGDRHTYTTARAELQAICRDLTLAANVARA